MSSGCCIHRRHWGGLPKQRARGGKEVRREGQQQAVVVLLRRLPDLEQANEKSGNETATARFWQQYLHE